jgi:hypothetical protein
MGTSGARELKMLWSKQFSHSARLSGHTFPRRCLSI